MSKSPCKNGKKKLSTECRTNKCNTKINLNGECAKKPGPKSPKKLDTKLNETEFYCVKCKHKVRSNVDDICLSKTSNSRYMLKSSCKHCNTTLNKFISMDNLELFKKKYSKCN